MPPPETKDYRQGVFINCPYDKDYIPLLRAVLFAVIRLGYRPETAAERLDCKEVRLDKIAGLIPLCRFGFHDLSRNRASKAGEYYRMNMPFELGIDWAWECYARKSVEYGKGLPKKFLIVESTGRSAKAAISDLDGSDFQVHDDSPEELITVVRDFFYEYRHGDGRDDYPDGHDIWREYNEFLADLQFTKDGRMRKQAELDRMIIAEFCDKVREWIGTRSKAG
ncbi:hypothetical protein [Haloferula sp. A504]|uniref:hypothetical protein n=1 Tax=Haloferula sp. A504 TaxID=3373601 RepID=UPI0031C0BB21|nr:hypothetical protein [Verrucomicrobiaceae bacterium E54]